MLLHNILHKTLYRQPLFAHTLLGTVGHKTDLCDMFLLCRAGDFRLWSGRTSGTQFPAFFSVKISLYIVLVRRSEFTYIYLHFECCVNTNIRHKYYFYVNWRHGSTRVNCPYTCPR